MFQDFEKTEQIFSNIRKILTTFIGNFSCKQFFKTLLKWFQTNLNAWEQFELFPNIFEMFQTFETF